MNLTRRGFMGSILALGAAPAIVRAESLMILPSRRIIVPALTMPSSEELRRMLMADFSRWFAEHLDQCYMERVLKVVD